MDLEVPGSIKNISVSLLCSEAFNERFYFHGEMKFQTF